MDTLHHHDDRAIELAVETRQHRRSSPVIHRPAPRFRGGVLRLEWIIEDAGTASALIQELAYQVPGVVGVRPDRDKIARIAIVTPQFEAGQVFLPEQATSLAELEAELFQFPHAGQQ